MRVFCTFRQVKSTFFAGFVAVLMASAHGQSASGEPNVPAVKGLTAPAEPEDPLPKATDFHDPKYKLSFHVPAGWNFERQDGALSDFHKEVRSAPRRIEVRGVASINFNPYPVSTFSGASLYYSVLPVSDAVVCAAQAASQDVKAEKDAVFAGKTFKHGEDHHGAICTESRDEVYTALRGQSCLRFDLVVDTFCHASSGAMEISKDQLKDLSLRMEKILSSIRLE